VACSASPNAAANERGGPLHVGDGKLYIPYI